MVEKLVALIGTDFLLTVRSGSPRGAHTLVVDTGSILGTLVRAAEDLIGGVETFTRLTLLVVNSHNT
jgi:hypothetical protein